MSSNSDVQMFELVMKQKGLQFEKEYKFLDNRRFRFDYAIVDYQIAIEIEGGVWKQGRHNRGVGFLGDMEKYNLATSKGWSILRTTPSEIFNLDFMKLIDETIEIKKAQYSN